MFDRRFFAEAVTLVILAAICGSVANVVAARERKLAFVGSYPNAQVVPQKRVTTPPPAPVTPDPAVPVATETTDPVAVDPASSTTSDPAPAAPVSNDPAPPAATVPAPVTPQAAAQKPPSKPAKQFLPTPDTVAEEITNAEAKQLFDQGAIFLDARRTGAFLEGHIPGARSFPVWEADIDDRVTAFFNEVADQRQPIVIYCTGGNCEDSHMLAQKLWGIGYETLLVYTDGFPGWQSIGGRVER